MYSHVMGGRNVSPQIHVTIIDANLMCSGGTMGRNYSIDAFASEFLIAGAFLKSIKSELVPAKTELLDALKDRYVEIVTQLKGKWSQIDDHLSALRSRAPTALKTFKSEYQTAYWKVRKCHETFASGGLEIALAKLSAVPIAKWFYNEGEADDANFSSGKFLQSPSSTDFDPEIFCIFSGDSAIDKLRGFLTNQNVAFNEKNSLQKALDEHKKRSGTCGVVSGFDINEHQLGMLDELFPPCGDERALTLMPGGRPWMRAYHNSKAQLTPQ